MTTNRRAVTIGAALAALWLGTLVAVDLAVPGQNVELASLFALAPLIACTVLPARPTAVVAGAAIAAAVGSGAWNGTWDAQQTVRTVDVVLISAAAVVIAAVRVRREKRHARVVAIAEAAQRAILPTLPDRVEQVAVATRYLSAAQDAFVGGDLYDFYHSDTYTRFLVGDVRGKGIAGVEQAARVIRAFRQSAPTRVSLSAVARDMNAYLAPFFGPEEFVTALLVDVSDPTCLTLVSCGHPQPLLVSGDGASLVDLPAGLPLGLGEAYASGTLPWTPGARLLMYTDGLSEARDADGEFLPMLTLAPLLRAGTPNQALDLVLDAVARHLPGGELTDDLAAVLLEYAAVPHPAPARLEEAEDKVSVHSG